MFNKRQKIIIAFSFIIALLSLFVEPFIVQLVSPVSFERNRKQSGLIDQHDKNKTWNDSLNQVIVVMENIPPYSYIINDSAAGFDVEVSKIIFEKLKLHPIYKAYTWSRCLEIMKSKNADVILTVFLTGEREKFLWFPDEFTSYEPNTFFTRKINKINYSGNLNDLKKIKVGVKSNTSYGQQFDRADFIKRDTSKNQETLIQKIVEKRLEIGIGSIPVISYIAKRMNCFNEIVFLKPYVTIDPMYIAFSKKNGNQELASDFSKELKEFKKSLSYNYLLKKYSISNSATR